MGLFPSIYGIRNNSSPCFLQWISITVKFSVLTRYLTMTDPWPSRPHHRFPPSRYPLFLLFPFVSFCSFCFFRHLPFLPFLPVLFTAANGREQRKQKETKVKIHERDGHGSGTGWSRNGAVMVTCQDRKLHCIKKLMELIIFWVFFKTIFN
jgi:hypothetical protein